MLQPSTLLSRICPRMILRALALPRRINPSTSARSASLSSSMALLLFLPKYSLLIYNLSDPTTSSLTYYVDCNYGNDSYSATLTTRAWRTMAKASQAPLNPGDQLLLKRGCTWNGPLRLSQNGTASLPIYVGAYYTGLLPTIQSSVSGVFVVVVTGSYITLEN